MVERIQDLNLPTAVVSRLIKEVLPDEINVSKEFRIAIARAASVFIIYLSSVATAEAKKHNLKTMNVQHVFDALEEIEFESFVEPLKETLEVYRKTVKEKKDNKIQKKDAPAADKKANDEDEAISINDDDDD